MEFVFKFVGPVLSRQQHYNIMDVQNLAHFIFIVKYSVNTRGILSMWHKCVGIVYTIHIYVASNSEARFWMT